MTNLPAFPYPWLGLERFLETRPNRRIGLMAYGSLMNAASAARTLVTTKRGGPRSVVIAEGVRRVFNCGMDGSGFRRYGDPVTEKHVAALGLIRTGNPEDKVNGVLQTVSLDDVARFRQREAGYQLTPVQAVDWHTGETLAVPVYVLEITDVCEGIYPHLAYLDVCSSGALSVSRAFLDFFEESTYLGDNQTRLKDWIASGGQAVAW